MPNPFVLRSSEAGSALTIDQVARDGSQGWRWNAELVCETLLCSLQFDGTYMRLDAFFADLAASWRGWQGERTWESLEGDLALSATHDGLGTVTIRARLRTDVVRPTGWSAEGDLFVDAGALDRIARDARGLAGGVV